MKITEVMAYLETGVITDQRDPRTGSRTLTWTSPAGSAQVVLEVTDSRAAHVLVRQRGTAVLVACALGVNAGYDLARAMQVLASLEELEQPITPALLDALRSAA